MQTNIGRATKHALLINQSSLQGICEFLCRQFNAISITANCSDGTVIESSDLNEIVNFPNHSFRRITHIKIRSSNSMLDSSSIEIGERYNSTASISTSSSDDAKALHVITELQKILREQKPVYSILARISASSVIVITPVIAFSIGYWIRLIRDGSLPTANISFVGLFPVLYVMLPIIIAYVIILFSCDRAWSWLFPRVFFLLGKQQDAFSYRSKIRNFLFGGVLLTILLGIAANWLFALIN